ncbi:MAG: class I SAM-dependent methyltransferase [Corynebacterium sp.]|uniref:class I SAM-dependent methyltransferase n=1 Tax=unclassified Corynebacterium TaxID=2624378 RepID=UPI00264ABCDD|nr:cyclopropane-fatty-acyl-phospholipid synthase family protein [Corynebacterium sp.]
MNSPVDTTADTTAHTPLAPPVPAPAHPSGLVPAPPQARTAARVTRRLLVRAARTAGITVAHAGDPAQALQDADLRVLRPGAFYARLGARGLTGFGESYTAGDWEADDLAGTLTALCRRFTTLVPGWMQRFRAVYLRRRPRSQRNTVDGARANISHHYDLSNDFFAAFLDPGMSYSSALFDPPGLDLRAAQDAKMDRALDRAGVGAGTRLLEIGTGWGELAIRAAGRGARVHTVTLSAEQAALARERAASAGVGDLVDVEIRDYREVTGTFDAVVSVEMVEAVGHEYWDDYMAGIRDRLTPGGTAVVQAITMDHDRMLASRDNATWITTYIFPGGCIPSVPALDAAARRAGLRPGARRFFGADYARTLALWDEACERQAGRIGELGFDAPFRRLWHFYLAYCRAGFAAGYIDVGQLEFHRPVDSTTGREDRS